MVFVGSIGNGIRYILAYLAPLANTLVGGGGFSVFWGWAKCLGVEWGFYLYLGSSFS